jgi:Ca2+-transporting ATPase
LGDALAIAAPAMITHVVASLRHGYGPRTRGLTFLSLASRQLAHALRLAPGQPAADLMDRPLELGVAAAYVLLAAPFAAPPLRRVLKLTPPTPVEAAVIIGLSLLPVAARLVRATADPNQVKT